MAKIKTNEPTPEDLTKQQAPTAADTPGQPAPAPVREKKASAPSGNVKASRSAAVKPAARKSADAVVRRSPADRDKFNLTFDNILYAALLMLTMLYFEVLASIAVSGTVTGRFFVYASFFAFAGGAILALITTAFPPKVNYILLVVSIWFITVYFGVQIIYVLFFKDYFYWELLGMAGDVTQFWRETLAKIADNLIPILLLITPAVLFTVFYARRKVRPFNWGVRAGAAVLAVVLLITGVGFIKSHDEPFDDAYYYGPGFTASESAPRFGILTTLRLDTQYLLFGKPEGEIDLPDTPGTLPEIPTLPIDPDGTQTEPVPETKPVEVITDPVDSRVFISIEGEKYELLTDPDGKMWIDYKSADGSTERREIVKNESGQYVLYIPPKPVDTSPNVLDIDWDSLIANEKNSSLLAAHKYFSTREPTNKNAYTGMFAGKNVIFISVEAWYPAAVDPVLTPTLYKMMTEGFVFNNYYCSMWGGSTATGEYANITGNFYRKASCLQDTNFAKTYQKFTLANMLNKEGYVSLGFHNGEYDYYKRNYSHVNFGYDWHGIGNWDVTFTKTWPASDKELGENILASIPTDGTPFSLYLMTISGHTYQAGNNAIAKMHYSDVLNATDVYGSEIVNKYPSQNAILYISSEYEVELMVNVISKYLEEKGLLENTVFVLAPDHIPYEIINDSAENEKILSVLSGLPVENIFVNPDLYRETLVIWTPDMKPVEVNKVCSAIDILPTLLNLFGLDYDSRLITGHDILSDTPGFVPLNMSNASGAGAGNNFITDYGWYYSKTKQFIPNASLNLTDDQISSIKSFFLSQLTAYNKYSPFILDNDYYAAVFPGEKK